jgi:hypothetical protein
MMPSSGNNCAVENPESQLFDCHGLVPRRNLIVVPSNSNSISVTGSHVIVHSNHSNLFGVALICVSLMLLERCWTKEVNRKVHLYPVGCQLQ